MILWRAWARAAGNRRWAIINDLKSDFHGFKQVEMIDMTRLTTTSKVLVVIHPKDITDKAQYAIDQFIMRAASCSLSRRTSLVQQTASGKRDDGPVARGRLEPGQTSEGLGHSVRQQGKVAGGFELQDEESGAGTASPWKRRGFLSVSADGINKDDIVTSETMMSWLPYSGVFTAPGEVEANGAAEDDEGFATGGRG